MNSSLQTNRKLRNNYNSMNRRNQHQEPLLSSISHQDNDVNMATYKKNGDLTKKSPLPASEVSRASRVATEISKGALSLNVATAPKHRPPGIIATTGSSVKGFITSSNRVTSSDSADLRQKAIRKRLYKKPIAVIVTGGILFAVGIAMAALFFYGFDSVEMIGPICLSMGLLVSVCGIVWIPIIQAKLKREQGSRGTSYYG